MKRKITLPENIGEINLGQYQNYIANPESKVSVFTGLTKKELDLIKQKDLDLINKQIDDALNTPSVFKQRFYLNNIEFGMIPNFDKITAKEYFDLSTYGVEVETLHNVMAIAFRPIVDRGIGNTYNIESYNGTAQYSELMKMMPLVYVNGFLSFFLTLQQDLLKHFQKSMQEVQARELERLSTFKNGGGMQLWMN